MNYSQQQQQLEQAAAGLMAIDPSRRQSMPFHQQQQQQFQNQLQQQVVAHQQQQQYAASSTTAAATTPQQIARAAAVAAVAAANRVINANNPMADAATTFQLNYDRIRQQQLKHISTSENAAPPKQMQLISSSTSSSFDHSNIGSPPQPSSSGNNGSSSIAASSSAGNNQASSSSNIVSRTCPICGKQFGNSSGLAKHRLTHSEERKYICPLLECGKAFKRQDHLTGHMMTHQEKKPFACPVSGCDKSYCDSRSLKRHVHQHDQAQIPSDFRQLFLDEDDDGGAGGGGGGGGEDENDTNHASDTNNDMLRISDEDKAKIQATAEQLLKQNASILLNAAVAAADGPTIGSSSSNNDLLAPKPYKCHVCGRRFRKPAGLNGHMRLHGGFNAASSVPGITTLPRTRLGATTTGKPRRLAARRGSRSHGQSPAPQPVTTSSSNNNLDGDDDDDAFVSSNNSINNKTNFALADAAQRNNMMLMLLQNSRSNNLLFSGANAGMLPMHHSKGGFMSQTLSMPSMTTSGMAGSSPPEYKPPLLQHHQHFLLNNTTTSTATASSSLTNVNSVQVPPPPSNIFSKINNDNMNSTRFMERQASVDAGNSMSPSQQQPLHEQPVTILLHDALGVAHNVPIMGARHISPMRFDNNGNGSTNLTANDLAGVLANITNSTTLLANGLNPAIFNNAQQQCTMPIVVVTEQQQQQQMLTDYADDNSSSGGHSVTFKVEDGMNMGPESEQQQQQVYDYNYSHSSNTTNNNNNSVMQPTGHDSHREPAAISRFSKLHHHGEGRHQHLSGPLQSSTTNSIGGGGNTSSSALRSPGYAQPPPRSVEQQQQQQQMYRAQDPNSQQSQFLNVSHHRNNHHPVYADANNKHYAAVSSTTTSLTSNALLSPTAFAHSSSAAHRQHQNISYPSHGGAGGGGGLPPFSSLRSPSTSPKTPKNTGVAGGNHFFGGPSVASNGIGSAANLAPPQLGMALCAPQHVINQMPSCSTSNSTNNFCSSVSAASHQMPHAHGLLPISPNYATKGHSSGGFGEQQHRSLHPSSAATNNNAHTLAASASAPDLYALSQQQQQQQQQHVSTTTTSNHASGMTNVMRTTEAASTAGSAMATATTTTALGVGGHVFTVPGLPPQSSKQQRSSRKPRPANLVLADDTATLHAPEWGQSLLRSPRPRDRPMLNNNASGGANSTSQQHILGNNYVPPYTPPPLLSPFRPGSGIFSNLFKKMKLKTHVAESVRQLAASRGVSGSSQLQDDGKLLFSPSIPKFLNPTRNGQQQSLLQQAGNSSAVISPRQLAAAGIDNNNSHAVNMGYDNNNANLMPNDISPGAPLSARTPFLLSVATPTIESCSAAAKLRDQLVATGHPPHHHYFPHNHHQQQLQHPHQHQHVCSPTAASDARSPSYLQQQQQQHSKGLVENITPPAPELLSMTGNGGAHITRQASATSSDASTSQPNGLTLAEPLETDIVPHINVGPAYQAVIPENVSVYADSNDVVDISESDHETLIWHPSTTAVAASASLSKDGVKAVKLFVEKASSAVVPFGYSNTELAFNVLQECKGNVKQALILMFSTDKLRKLVHDNDIAAGRIARNHYEWNQNDVRKFCDAMEEFDKDFFLISEKFGDGSATSPRTSNECVEFYYWWKKACPDDFRRLRTLRRKRELELYGSAGICTNAMPSAAATSFADEAILQKQQQEQQSYASVAMDESITTGMALQPAPASTARVAVRSQNEYLHRSPVNVTAESHLSPAPAAGANNNSVGYYQQSMLTSQQQQSAAPIKYTAVPVPTRALYTVVTNAAPFSHGGQTSTHDMVVSSAGNSYMLGDSRSNNNATQRYHPQNQHHQNQQQQQQQEQQQQHVHHATPHTYYWPNQHNRQHHSLLSTMHPSSFVVDDNRSNNMNDQSDGGGGGMHQYHNLNQSAIMQQQQQQQHQQQQHNRRQSSMESFSFDFDDLEFNFDIVPEHSGATTAGAGISDQQQQQQQHNLQRNSMNHQSCAPLQQQHQQQQALLSPHYVVPVNSNDAVMTNQNSNINNINYAGNNATTSAAYNDYYYRQHNHVGSIQNH